MADSVQSIYNYLGQQGDVTAKTIQAGMNSLIQTRTMQLRQQEQAFNQFATLKQLDMKEQDMRFDQGMAVKKLGMEEKQMGFQEKLNAAQLASSEALTNYRNAQTTKITANQVAAENIPYPVNGSPEEIIQWEAQVNGTGAAFKQSWTGTQETAQGAYVPDPNDPLDMETARAYAEQGGEVSTGSSLPSDDGSEATGALFDNAGAAVGGMGGMRPYPPIKLDPTQKAVVGVAAATAIQTTPKDDFERFFQAANYGISSTLANPQIPQGTKTQLISKMNQGLMRGAMQYRENPKAKAFLNDVAPERERVRAAAARGDEAMVQSIIRANEARIGSFNPILADAEAEGYEQYATNQQKEDQAKNRQALLTELKDLRSIQKDAATSGIPDPLVDARITQLTRELFSTPEPSRLDSLRPGNVQSTNVR